MYNYKYLQKTEGKELKIPAKDGECNVDKVVSKGPIELKVVKPDMKLISKSL